VALIALERLQHGNPLCDKDLNRLVASVPTPEWTNCNSGILHEDLVA